jgi:3'-phosphoadenosine 5'-phosphosulfate sulfotransferase
MAWLGSLFQKLGKLIKSFLGSSPVKSLLKSALGKIVVRVVTELENVPNMTGEEKRTEAIKRITAEAAAAGIEVKTKVRNLIIEIVVNKLSLAKAKLSVEKL